MAKNDVMNQKKLNNAFNVCRYIAVVLGMIFLSTWTVKSASQVNPTKQELQQNLYKEITGIVKTEDGDPIPGVVVKLAGTNIETATDAEGRYKFNANEGDKIQFVFEGFKTVIFTVSQSNILNIVMIEDDTNLSLIEDIYRTMVKDRMAHGNKVSSDIIGNRKPISVIYESNYGFTPLYLPPNNHPEKYRNPETILKDVENLTRNGKYTYIVDGVRVSEETFRSLNQNDVESVDICKHTDMYNARFGNKENQSRITLEAI